MELLIIITHTLTIDFKESLDYYDLNSYCRFKWLNKSKQQKMFSLKSISNRNKSFVYHIGIKVSDETHFVEMRKQRLTTSFILTACTSTKFNAKIILITTGIPIVKVSKSVYKFSANTTDEMMIPTSNCGEIFYNHRNIQDIRTNGVHTSWQ